ncbi:hypothetical protein HED60_10485 [Planctomycetales bacterium ZRK34]|nr:hypothetical protein HED60_10485 [Planctomycetales bacterium ZRK34]
MRQWVWLVMTTVGAGTPATARLQAAISAIDTQALCIDPPADDSTRSIS